MSERGLTNAHNFINILRFLNEIMEFVVDISFYITHFIVVTKYFCEKNITYIHVIPDRRGIVTIRSENMRIVVIPSNFLYPIYPRIYLLANISLKKRILFTLHNYVFSIKITCIFYNILKCRYNCESTKAFSEFF